MTRIKQNFTNKILANFGNFLTNFLNRSFFYLCNKLPQLFKFEILHLKELFKECFISYLGRGGNLVGKITHSCVFTIISFSSY